MQDICDCIYNYSYGVTITGDSNFSTSFSRYFYMKNHRACEEDKLCHLYATRNLHSINI